MEAQQDPRNPNLLLEVQQIALISTWEERIEREGPWTFHEGFFEGTETTTTTGSQPCEQKFLDYIIDDFILVSLNAQWELLEIGAAIDRELPPSAIRIADLFRKLMAQCRRLKASPELFPSPGSRKNFFQKVAILSTFMGNLAKIFAEYDKFQRDAYKPIVDMKQPLTIAVNSGEQATPETGSTVRAIPVFLQHKENAKNPWNNWLDNSANPMPGWIAIQQKIPRTGDKLIRQITQLYDTVNNELTQNNQVALEVKDDEEMPGPGEAFRHMTWAGFCTVPYYNLGFLNGRRKSYDYEGVATLEYLSKGLCRKADEPGVQQRSFNTPYFRYAMAYQKSK